MYGNLRYRVMLSSKKTFLSVCFLSIASLNNVLFVYRNNTTHYEHVVVSVGSMYLCRENYNVAEKTGLHNFAF